MSITPEQCRGARALLSWSQDDLATVSSVAKSTIANFEAGNRSPYPRTLGDLRAAFERAGMEFPGKYSVDVAYPIVAALVTLTVHVRRYADMHGWNVGYQPSPDEEKARTAAVLAVCDEMDELAQRARTEDVRFPDFEVLRGKLTELGHYPLNAHMGAVANAFFDAGRLDRRAE